MAETERDFEAEGLLQGCDPADRPGRIALVEQLLADGASLDEVKGAITEDRLFMLPIERALAGPASYTARDLAHRTGVDLDFILDVRHALGAARPNPDERSFSEHDLEAFRLFGRLLEAGLDRQGLIEVGRLLARGLSAGADAVRGLVGRPMIRTALSEREITTRSAQILDATLPLTGPLLAYILRVQLLEHIRGEVAGLAEIRAEGRVPGSRRVAVCFADLVGFTTLGERLSMGDVGQLVARFEQLTAEIVEPPVRLVKTIGDAVMLVSDDVDAAAAAALQLVSAVRAAGQLPQLRAGIAYGTAINRSGDWYGSTVNRASRLTTVAEPECVVVDAAGRDALSEAYAGRELGRRRLGGIDEPVAVFAISRASQ